MAVRYARGYLNWASSHEPKVTRSTSIKLSEIRHSKIILGMLSPGGKFFVFWTDMATFIATTQGAESTYALILESLRDPSHGQSMLL